MHRTRSRIAACVLATACLPQPGAPALAQNKTPGEIQLEEEIRDMRARRDEAARTQKMQEELRSSFQKSFSGIPQMNSVDPLPVRVSNACAREWDSFAKPRNALPLKMGLAKSFNDQAGACRLAPEVKANAEHVQAIAERCLAGTSAQSAYLDKARATEREMDVLIAQCAAPPTSAPAALAPVAVPHAERPGAPKSGLQTCRAATRGEAGEVQVAILAEGDRLKTVSLSFTRPPLQVDAGGGRANVALDMKVTMGSPDTFEGLGLEIGLPSGGRDPADVAITINGVTASRANVAPSEAGLYAVRLAAGPLKGNALADAFNEGSSARVTVTSAGRRLFDAELPLGSAKAREDLAGEALDAADRKLKAGDCA